MAELKTKLTNDSVEAFLNKIDNEQKRKDCFEIVGMMSEVTKAPAKMWGGSIIGFGNQVLKYESGRDLDWFVMGFSPRKATIAIYGLGSSINNYPELTEKLGKHKTGKGCLYINALKDVNIPTLKALMKKSK